jgi:hypothetical protein
MPSLLNANLDSYKLIITRRECRELLLSSMGRCYGLPNLEIHPNARVAEQLTERFHAASGIRVFCRFASEIHAVHLSYAVLEAIEDDVHPGSSAFTWIPLQSLRPDLVVAQEDRRILSHFLDQSAACERQQRADFARPGWLQELLRWTQTQIDPCGIRITGRVRQLNASPTFSLIRIETTGPAVWFKATGEPIAHERSLSLYLAQQFPQHVPVVVGVHEKWNGWLSWEAVGLTLDESEHPLPWELAASQFAELQIASMDATSALTAAGCQDFRHEVLARNITPFLGRMTEFMEVQRTQTPAPLTRNELSRLSERLHNACRILEKPDFPFSLAHTDLNPGNVIVGDHGCRFLDWAGGCVTHPFVALEYLLAHARRHSRYQNQWARHITRAYLRPWKACFPEQTVCDAIVFSPLIAVFTSALTCSTWQSIDPSKELSQAGYFRSLTRRMFRESELLAEKRKCVAVGRIPSSPVHRASI